jgi:hypothetical protein
MFFSKNLARYYDIGNKFDVEEVEAIYELGDSNGDNVLDLGEFIAILFPAAGEAIAKLRRSAQNFLRYPFAECAFVVGYRKQKVEECF